MAPPSIHLVRWESVEPAAALDLQLRNREHVGRWSPASPPGFHTLDGQRARSLESANARAAGRGYATEAVRQLLLIAFGELRLHRVQAAVMPSNAASLRVLAHNGFREEGLALRYLCINGVWEDHRILARTVEDPV